MLIMPSKWKLYHYPTSSSGRLSKRLSYTVPCLGKSCQQGHDCIQCQFSVELVIHRFQLPYSNQTFSFCPLRLLSTRRWIHFRITRWLYSERQLSLGPGYEAYSPAVRAGWVIIETKLAKEQIIEVDLQTKTIANSMGFSLINQLQNIQKEVRSLKGGKKGREAKEPPPTGVRTATLTYR